jgi:nitrate reductase gamma subunit
MTLLHGMVLLAAVVFVVAIVARGIRIARTPMHLRWEIYPVPHEGKRSAHGGSRMEETDWWTKPIHKDHLREILVMIPEILFLKAVWEHNRPLWFPSWTLHFGLYLLIGNMFLIILTALLAMVGVALPMEVVHTLITILAWAGCAIGTIGAITMFMKRAFDPKLKMYTNPSHFFNIIHLGVIYVAGLAWLATDAAYGAHVVALYKSLFTFTTATDLSMAAYVHIGAVILFFIYLPFTHMTHFFTKYFTYHDVRWEDEPNLPGGKLEEKIKKVVSQPVTWAAPHIGADGKKNWADLVAGTGAIEDKKESK